MTHHPIADEKKRSVYIVDGARTPFIKALGQPNPWSAADLAVAAAGPLLARQPFNPTDIEEVIAGCVVPAVDEANIGRIIALRLGCGTGTLGWTVQRNCGSGLQALESAAFKIMHGHADLILAGGTECMSRSPVMYQTDLLAWLANIRTARDLQTKLKAVIHFKPAFLMPVVSLLKGLTDPVVNLTMGQTAENLVYQFGLAREELDQYALQSHQKATLARKNGFLEEITPLFDWRGNVMVVDNGVREESSLSKLANLKPVFDKPFGQVTAGNSSQVSDGAAFLILASAEAVKKYGLPVMGRMVDAIWTGLDPAVMGLGPVYAIQKLLSKNQLSSQDIDFWEINEAFSAQILACLQAMEDTHWMQTHAKVEHSVGGIPVEKLNVDGGAIAIGHPVAATGARLVLHLLHVLKRHRAMRGVASLCVGGGQGGAMLLECSSEVI